MNGVGRCNMQNHTGNAGAESKAEIEALTPEEPQTKVTEEFDDILDIIGSQGRFQKFLLYVVVCPITAIQPFLTLNAIFMLFTPEHWCHVPGRDNYTDLETWKIRTIPLDPTRLQDAHGHPKYSQCSMYGEDGEPEACKWGWEFDTTDYLSTLPGDFAWVCDNSAIPTNAFTASAIGNAVGTIVFGHFADKYGRKPIFFLTITINIVFRIVSLLHPSNVKFFYLCQFIIGTAFPVMFIAPSMIAAEICDYVKDETNYYPSSVQSMGLRLHLDDLGDRMCGLPLVAWLCSDWYLIGLSTSVPAIAIYIYLWYLPESPRWLLSIGKHEQASKSSNNKSEDTSVAELNSMLRKLVAKQNRKKEAKNIGVWTLFSRARLARNTVSMNVLVYYGITLNTTNMPGNQFVNFFLLSIIELPSGWAGGVLADKLGRRWVQVVFFLVCMISCVGATFVIHIITLELIAVVLAKFAITLTFLVVYLQGAEIFPTQLRYTGSGFASTIGAIAGIFAPIIAQLSIHHLSYPYWIMGMLCIIGLVVSAFLPETLNQNLPETIDDANKFGKGVKFWSTRSKSITSTLGSLRTSRRSTAGQGENALDPPIVVQPD
ncbi:Organic cation transporter 1 [Orchesella cincta]|uniref:Organic cation transporter 1 n=1 Tax=Orchesella cincta TaxID=48709 RepID=A0A1D2MKH2_ORCCI|nr:Organic cation transporter 1 [Orchesella cincta]